CRQTCGNGSAFTYLSVLIKPYIIHSLKKPGSYKRMALLNRLFLLIGALLATTATMAQNLVPNPGFESYSSLPGNYGQYYLAIGWSNVNNNTTGPPYGSPDYFHTSGGLGTYFGQIAPHGGSA